MGDVYWSVHTPLAALAAKSGIKVAVETGTFFGSGALQLAALFNEVWTVERHEKLSKEMSLLYASVPNLNFVNKQAANGLSDVAQQTSGPYFFFLDAHWFPANALAEEKPENEHCEILEEIHEIAKHCNAHDGSILVIDDADMFLRSLPPVFDDSFPSIAKVFDALKTIFGASFVEVVDDVIFASSEDKRKVFEQYSEIRGRVGCPRYKETSV
jgi:hypothetical protein